MEKLPYALISCLATGAPWSEQTEGTTFQDFMASTFGSSVAGGVPSQSQDMEFSCAHPSRNGSNSILKGASACHFPDARETPRVIFAVRGLWLSAGEADTIRSPLPGKSVTKFWLAVRARQEIVIPADVGNDRSSPYRRRPSEIAACLPPGLLSRIQQGILESVENAE